MKALLLTSRFPWPADRGDRLTVLNVLRVLSAAHEVTLASFTDGREPPDAIEQVSRYCARVETVHLSRPRSWLQAWAGLPLLSPSQVSFYHSLRMRRLVERLLKEERYDVVLAHLIRMAPYAVGAARLFAAMAPHEMREGFRKTYGEVKSVWNKGIEKELREAPRAQKGKDEKRN